MRIGLIMDEKIIERLRFDFYGELLSEKQKTILDYYYNDDFSLAEISEIIGITRQGVFDAYKRANHLMMEYEEKLGLLKRYLKDQELLRAINEKIVLLIENDNVKAIPELKNDILTLRQSIDEIIEGH